MVNVFETILGKDEKPIEGSTQQHLPIQTIHDDIVILKDGSAALILQTSAVNFDLLSEGEQLAIIASFAGMLNSLSFAIQIVVRSKRLDVTEYLEHLSEVEKKQTNNLLREMMKRYRTFVENLTQQNEVLDKQFYVVIPVSFLEIGIMGTVENNLSKAMTLLVPRRDHIMKQLSRIGLKSSQLNNSSLVKLFYDIYNESYQDQDIRAFIDKKVAIETSFTEAKKQIQQQEKDAPHNQPQPQPLQKEIPATPPPSPVLPNPPVTAAEVISFEEPIAPTQPSNVVSVPAPVQTPQPPTAPQAPGPVFEPIYLQTRTADQTPGGQGQPSPVESLFQAPRTARPTIPFVVEELIDEYGAAT